MRYLFGLINMVQCKREYINSIFAQHIKKYPWNNIVPGDHVYLKGVLYIMIPE